MYKDALNYVRDYILLGELREQAIPGVALDVLEEQASKQSGGLWVGHSSVLDNGECVACVVVVIRGGLIHIRHNKLDFLRAPRTICLGGGRGLQTCGETQSNGHV